MTYLTKKRFLTVRGELWICFLLVFATLAVYYQVKNFEFINFDTGLYVFENSHVKEGLTAKSISWAVTSMYADYWHPLTWLSHMLDVQLYGLDAGRHHLTNVIWHIVNTLLLFGVLNRMTGSLARSGLVAALFALHPLHVESVAWVAERKDLLSTFFGLLVIWSYTRYVQRPRIGNYLPVLLFFILGIMAKPMIVTWPFVLLLLDYWPLKRLQIKKTQDASGSETQISSKAEIALLIVEKIPLFIISAASCIITLHAQKAVGAVISLTIIPLQFRIANALVSYMTYIGKMFWPSKLAALYLFPDSLSIWQVVGCTFLIIVISCQAIVFIKSRPWFIVGWLWYLGTMVPVIGLVQVGVQARADRYTYIPFIGLFIIVAWGLSEFLKKWRYKEIGFAVTALTMVIFLSAITWKQAGYWKNELTFFGRELAVSQDNYIAHNNFGKALVKQGKTAEAIAHFKKALEINPRFAAAHLNLGLALLEQNSLNDALQSFSSALELLPDDAIVFNCLGKTQNRLGNYNQAVPNFLKAIKINPFYAEAYNQLGISLYRLGKPDQAIPNFLQAIKNDPQYVDAYNNVGAALVLMGQTQKSLLFFREALRIEPDHLEARNNLIKTLATLKKHRDL